MIRVTSTFVILVVRNCPDGYDSIAQDLEGPGKLWSQPETDPNRSIQQCADICNDRSGCTSFEYADGETEKGACATYTGGDSNIQDVVDQNRTHPTSIWFSCIKALGDGPWTNLNSTLTNS